MQISLVIPAYNEEGRLPAFLTELQRWHAEHPTILHEVFVVDDGSTDRTAHLAEAFTASLPLRVIRFPQNRGKGAAVQAGVLAATSEAVVFMDADGATAPHELPKMLETLQRAPIAVGNRWISGSQVTDREPLRALSSWVYRTYVSFFGLGDIDTMCGFKGYRRAVAQELFRTLREERWLFDTEIALRARKRGYATAAVPITWTSKHGSKLGLPALIRSALSLPRVAFRVAQEH